MQKSPYQVALIGAGRIGKLHAETISRHCPQVRIKTIVEVAASDELSAWAQTLQISQIEPDYRTVLADAEIDAVFILSPTSTHADIIDAAAAAGKHIFCEKPIDLSIARALVCKKNVEKSGVKFQLGFNRRFDHNFSAIRTQVENGDLGELRSMRVTSRDPGLPPETYIENSGGIFYDMSIHDFDMVRFLSGAEVREVYARGASLINDITAQYGDCDTAIISMILSNGAFAYIDNCRETAYGYDQRVELLGSKAMVECQNDYPTGTTTFDASGRHGDKPYYFFLERYKDTFKDEVIAFVEAIATDQPPPVGIDDGIQSLFIAEAALRSWQRQQNILVSDVMQEFLRV